MDTRFLSINGLGSGKKGWRRKTTFLTFAGLYWLWEIMVNSDAMVTGDREQVKGLVAKMP